MRNFDNQSWDRVREDAVLAGTIAKFSQNPKHETIPSEHWHQILAEASPFDPVWDIGLQADDPRLATPAGGQDFFFSEELFLPSATPFAQARQGLANPASSHQFCTPTSPDRIHEISLGPPYPMALARACPGPPPEFSTCFSDAPADNSPEVLGVAPGVPPSRFRNTAPASSAGSLLSTTPLSLLRSRFTAELTPLRRADEQPLPLALRRLLLIMASGPVRALVHPHGVPAHRRESHGRDRLWVSLRSLIRPRRVPQRY